MPNDRTSEEHPLVTRLLKGIFELKPSLPHYSCFADVGVVLRYFQATDYSEAITQARLIKKITTLLVLTAQRCRTFANLDINHLQ